MNRRTFLQHTSAAGLLTLLTPTGFVQARRQPAAAGDLAASFKNPPPAARPQVVWHWMNGNVTKEGITLDLEAMQRVGIGGFVNFDAGTGIPKGPVVYLSPEWLALKQHTIREAQRLGLDFAMHNCPGWSSSGGPWITPALAMQELTWSETHVVGGGRRAQAIRLPQPLTRLGYYQPVAVLAFPALPGEAALAALLAGARSSQGAVATGQLDGSEPAGVVVRPAQAGEPGWLLLEFRQPYEATALTLNTAVVPDEQQGKGQEGFVARVAPTFVLEASDDGAQFRKVVDLDAGSAPDDRLLSVSFPAVRARYFRLRSSQGRHYAQLRLSGATPLATWQQRANFAFGWSDVEGPGRAQTVAPSSIIDPAAIVDLTALVSSQGTLSWQAPAGNWTILRLGFTPLGTLNRSAPDTGVGLECDKYSRAALAFHFDKMMASLLPTLGPLAERGAVGLEIDSYEVGMQNWTPEFPQEFARRRGYDLRPYLPALTGRVVGSPDASSRFLYDVRRAQGDLIADNYYGAFTELCHQHGITSYMQPYDRGPMEEMQIGARGDLNMGEFWNGLSTIFQNNLTMRRTVKLAASIAHVNGHKVAAAEAFTGEPESARWQEYPFAMKPLADKNFCLGLNRLFFHRFAHQPHPTAVPGMTMGPWGIHFERTTTWWEPGRAWLLYLARCQSLLQQGLFVADLAYFTGEQANQYTKVERHELTPPPPAGYDYDLLPPEALLRARCEQGRLVLADGMSYRVLVLQQHPGLSLAVLGKLRELVSQGLTVVGARPAHSLGLRDQASEAVFQQALTDLWGPGGAAPTTDHALGQGRVLWGPPLSALLASLPLAPDFSATSRSGDAPLTYIHRQVDGAEVYFVANQRRTAEEVVCTFRVAGKLPEVWDAVTGHTVPASVYAAEAGGRTRVALQLGPAASVFVVFRTAAPARPLQAVLRGNVPLLTAAALPARPRQLYPDVTNSFTISCWAKPEINSMLHTRNVMEKVADPWTDFYAIYPPPGAALYGAQHATCGLAVGRNGLAVWEHGAGKPVLVFAAPAALAGWSHVALVYRQGAPSLYLNGQLLGTGTASAYTVHPGVGPAYLQEGASYFYGDLSAPVLVPEALSAARLGALAAQPRPAGLPAGPAVELAGDERAQLLFWQDGQYQLRDGAGRTTPLPITGAGQPETLTGPWQVSFPPKLGAPARISLPALQSWRTHAQSGVKYFSGTATYSKTITIAASRLAGTRRLYLDLGEVEILAEVRLNGHDLGILWTRPYRVDITAAARPGANQLEIRVTNQWPNRLIGDEQLPDPDQFTPGGGASGFLSLANGAIEQLPDWYRQGQPKPDDGRVTFTTWKHYNKDSPLLEAGLLGPVRLLGAVPYALPT